MFRDRAWKDLSGSCPKYLLKFYFKQSWKITFGIDPELSFTQSRENAKFKNFHKLKIGIVPTNSQN